MAFSSMNTDYCDIGNLTPCACVTHLKKIPTQVIHKTCERSCLLPLQREYPHPQIPLHL